MPASKWNALSESLRELHRALVDCARTAYLQQSPGGGEIGPSQLLRLLTTDPHFAWLRSLSELMVDIDVLHDAGGSTNAAELEGSVRASVEALISPAPGEAAHPFVQHYRPCLQHPEVAIAHAAVKRALLEWPKPTAGSSPPHRDQLAAAARKHD